MRATEPQRNNVVDQRRLASTRRAVRLFLEHTIPDRPPLPAIPPCRRVRPGVRPAPACVLWCVDAAIAATVLREPGAMRLVPAWCWRFARHVTPAKQKRRNPFGSRRSMTLWQALAGARSIRGSIARSLCSRQRLPLLTHVLACILALADAAVTTTVFAPPHVIA